MMMMVVMVVVVVVMMVVVGPGRRHQQSGVYVGSKEVDSVEGARGLGWSVGLGVGAWV